MSPFSLPLSLSRRSAAAIAAAALTFTLAACSSGDDGTNAEEASVAESAPVERLTPEIVATHPWNPESFTQGVEVDEDGSLIVGTGMNGESRIYRTTMDGQESDSHDLEEKFFGEGITIHGDKVWQLTWKLGTAFERNRDDLSEIRTVNYEGEGWGICSDGSRLIMTDGSGALTFRDPETFDKTGSVEVTVDGRETTYLNELDCSEDGNVYANVWQTDQILRIDPETGHVTGVVDATGAFDAQSKPGADVLNGIAQIPGTDRYLLTGKKWDTAYEVRFVPAVS